MNAPSEEKEKEIASGRKSGETQRKEIRGPNGKIDSEAGKRELCVALRRRRRTINVGRFKTATVGFGDG
jgi:hypothetical protein